MELLSRFCLTLLTLLWFIVCLRKLKNSSYRTFVQFMFLPAGPSGFGFILCCETDTTDTYVLHVLNGSPARKASLKPGDRIIEVRRHSEAFQPLRSTQMHKAILLRTFILSAEKLTHSLNTA